MVVFQNKPLIQSVGGVALSRRHIEHFQQIPNVGKATEADFNRLGFSEPKQLIGKDPYVLHKKLCDITNISHDPCVIDVFISAIKYMEGGPAKKWWVFTQERKNILKQLKSNSNNEKC